MIKIFLISVSPYMMYNINLLTHCHYPLTPHTSMRLNTHEHSSFGGENLTFLWIMYVFQVKRVQVFIYGSGWGYDRCSDGGQYYSYHPEGKEWCDQAGFSLQQDLPVRVAQELKSWPGKVSWHTRTASCYDAMLRFKWSNTVILRF